MPVWIQIDAYDPVAAAPVTLRAGNQDDASVCMAADGPWWPMIAKAPVLRYDLFDGAFGGDITAPTTSFSLQIEAWPNFGRYAIADARVRVWTDIAGAPVFDGRATSQPQLANGQAEISIKVDDSWLDKPLLATYAGTTGIEGPAALKGQPKPLALGAPRYVAGKLIDSVNNVFQVSAYGAVQGFEAALERLARFGSPVADYATYAALVAASIPGGAWATCTAQGLARFGAPTTGQVSFLVQGDVAGPDGWARKPGQLIRRLALLSGGSGKIHDASLNALDTTRPYNLSIYLDQQTTARQLIQSIAASANAVAGVSWTGQLFVVPVGLGDATMTLAADGTALPPVRSVEQLEVAAPFAKIALTAERAWTVHQLADIAFVDPLVDMGVYNNGFYYRPGNIVQWAGATWRYKTGVAPGSGNAPPTPPTSSNTWWTVLAQQGAAGARGADGVNGTAFTLLNKNGTTVGPDSITKFSGFLGWDSAARSQEAFAGGAFVSCRLKAGDDFVLGVSTDPSAGNSINDVDYGWYASGDGALHASESGLLTGDWPYSAGDVISIVYDGQRVTWYQNGTVRHVVADSGNLVLYLDSAIYQPGFSITGIRFGQAGPAGTNGINTATINIFQRGATAPALPTATTTYTYATSSVSGLNNGWSTTIPAGTAPLWQSAATAASQNATDTIAASEWASPVQIAANGSSAASSAPVLLYNRTSTASAPAVPSTTVTYDFGTAVASGMNNGWTQSLPASGGAYRWQINATAVSTTGTDTIAPSEWSAPNIMAQDGANGTPALSVSLAPSSIPVPCTAGGTPKAALPGAQFNVFQGSTDVTGSTTYSVGGVSNLSGVSVSSGGAVTVGGITGGTAVLTGTATITASKDGASQSVQLVYNKALDGAAFVDGSALVSAPSSTSYATVATLSLLMGPSGTVEVDTSGGYSHAGGGSLGVQGTIDYSLDGSSWTTGVSFTGNAAISGEPGDWAASATISGSSMGLSAKQTVYLRVQMRKTSTIGFSSFTGSLYVSWSG